MKAKRLLGEADAMLQINLTEAAARTSYLAGFHAAQAFIWEQTGKSVKTHQGVHREFYRLTKDDPDIDPELRIFLSITYNLKAIGNCPGWPLGFAIDGSRADVSQGVDDIARRHWQTGQRRFGLGTV